MADLMPGGGASGARGRYRLRLDGVPPSLPVESACLRVVGREGDVWTVDLDGTLQPVEIWRNLLSRGWPIIEIRREDSGLEALYLSLTEGKAA